MTTPRHPSPTTKTAPFTPRMSRIIDRSLAIATDNGHNYVGTEHVLLALLEDEHGIAYQAIASKTDPAAIANEMAALMTSAKYQLSDQERQALG